MRTDSEIKHDAFRLLLEKLGILETERFIMLINNDSFDYTQWRENLPEYSPIEELSNDAMKYRKQTVNQK